MRWYFHLSQDDPRRNAQIAKRAVQDLLDGVLICVRLQQGKSPKLMFIVFTKGVAL